MKKRTLVISFFLILATGFVFSSSSMAADLPDVKWDLPLMSAPTFYITKDLEKFVKDVEEKTKGKFKIILHPGSSLLKQDQLAPGVISGRVPIAPVGDFNVYDIMPKLGVLFLPFFTSSTEEFQKGGDALRDTFYAILEEKGLKPLFTWTWPPNHLHSQKPMDTLAAWKGKKIRIYNSEQAQVVKALGGVPTRVAFSEVYTAMQRNTVDAFITSNPNIPVMKFYEVSKYATQWTIHGGGIDYLCVNQKAWDDLPEPYQKALLEAIQETKIEEVMWESAKRADRESIQQMKDKDVIIAYPSKEELEKIRQIASDEWDIWAKQHGAEDLLEKAKTVIGH